MKNGLTGPKPSFGLNSRYKMQIFSTLLLGLASWLALQNTVFAQTESDAQAIRDILQRQTEAWNTGHLEEFMEGYWRSDSLAFIGQSGITYGWQATLDNYRRNYPTPEKMGQLRFDIIRLTWLGPESALVLGRWFLQRKKDAPQGYFSLTWKKINGEWVIIADHSS